MEDKELATAGLPFRKKFGEEPDAESASKTTTLRESSAPNFGECENDQIIKTPKHRDMMFEDCESSPS